MYTHSRIGRALARPKNKAWLTLGLFLIGFIMTAAISRLSSFTADPKATIGCLTAGLSVSGLGYCLIDAIWGNNRPHVYSWLIWAMVNAVAWANQWAHGAGPGAWSTLAMTILSGMVFLVALYQHARGMSKQPITHIDQWCLAGAGISILLLIIFETGPISIVAATIVDALAFIPTLKKIWRRPGSETPVNYALNTLRHIIVLFAIESYSFVTILFPASLIALNAITVAAIVLRRRALN